MPSYMPRYKLAISVYSRKRKEKKNPVWVQRVDERYFWLSCLPNPKRRTKIFSSPSPRPKGGRSSTPLSSSLPSSSLSASSAAAAMVALASLSSLCPCGLARRSAASVSISCCAVATPSSGKGTAAPSPPYLRCLLRVELWDWKRTHAAGISISCWTRCRGIRPQIRQALNLKCYYASTTVHFPLEKIWMKWDGLDSSTRKIFLKPTCHFNL